MDKYLQLDNTIDVISSGTISDYNLFFGPITEGITPFIIDTALKISDVLVALGLAQSKTWCRKNNWDWEIPAGYSEVKFGMKKVRLCIYVKPVEIRNYYEVQNDEAIKPSLSNKPREV